MENCLWCYFKHLFIALAFRKCKKDFNIVNIFLVQDFCPFISKLSLLDFLSDFVLICTRTRERGLDQPRGDSHIKRTGGGGARSNLM